MLCAGQFAILKNRIDLPGYRHVSLKDGWILSVHENLPAAYCPQNDILLVGFAWQALPGRGTPEEEIKKLVPDGAGAVSDQQILEMEGSWCGRYVLVCDGRVFLDASAMLGVFYADEGIASRASMLAEQKGMEERLYQCGRVMNWQPGPLTHYEGICRLLAFQIYNYKTKQLTGKRMLSAAAEQITDEQELIRRFQECFCFSLKSMAAMFPGRKLLIALTGGYDSRTLFALAKKAGIDFAAYTLEHGAMLAGDAEIPRVLCEKAHVPYLYVPRDKGEYSEAREQAYHAYTDGMVLDEDRLFYAYNQYQKLVDQFGDVVLLRSSLWENVIEYFRRLFGEDKPNEDFYGFFELPPDSLEHRSIQAYFAWCEAHPQPGVPLSDRFLWEQREGSWMSSIEQGFAAIDHVISLQPVNCRLMMTMLYRFPRESRLLKWHQAQIINDACPELQDVPYANARMREETLASVIKTKIKKGVHRIKKQGVIKTIRTYFRIFRHRMEENRLKKGHG